MPSTYRQKFLKHYNLEDRPYSLSEIARISGIPKSALQEVYNRGIGAWKTNPESVRLKKDFSKNPDMSAYPRSARLSKEAWAFARVYSFVMKGKTYRTADADIAVELRN